MESVDAFCMRFEKKDYICINKNKNHSRIEKYWLLEHELEHIKNDTFYTCENKRVAIQRRERKTNDALILKHGLVEPNQMILFLEKKKPSEKAISEGH